jgi:hypothetical protein
MKDRSQARFECIDVFNVDFLLFIAYFQGHFLDGNDSCLKKKFVLLAIIGLQLIH